MSTLRRRFVALGATAIAASLVLAGCAASDEEATGGSTSGGSSSGGDTSAAGCEAHADHLGNEGSEVVIYTTIIDPEASLFIESFKEFEDCTGITLGHNTENRYASTPSQARLTRSSSRRLTWSQAGSATVPSLMFPGTAAKSSQMLEPRPLLSPSTCHEAVAAPTRKSLEIFGLIDRQEYSQTCSKV